MIVNSIEVYRLKRLLENESSLLRSIMSLEEIQKIIAENSYARKLLEEQKKIRAEIVKIERKG